MSSESTHLDRYDEKSRYYHVNHEQQALELEVALNNPTR